MTRRVRPDAQDLCACLRGEAHRHFSVNEGVLAVFTRDRSGSIASGKLRRDGKVPGIVFDQVSKKNEAAASCDCVVIGSGLGPDTRVLFSTVWE